MATFQDVFGEKKNNNNQGASFQSVFGNDGTGGTTNEITPDSIKESLKDVEGSKYGFMGSFAEDVKGFFGDIGELASLGWTELVSNKDTKKGINDWDEYQKRMKEMSNTETSEEYNALYNKMVEDNIIDKEKHEGYLAEQKAGKYYKFEQVKSLDKQTFYNQLDEAISPIISNTTNRYQIDSISQGIEKIEHQYSLFYDNVMEVYKDTRDERILDEWNKIRAEYENDILQFTKNWAENLVGNNMTFSKAYSKTLGEGSNEAFANGISKIERDLSNKMYKFTIQKNLTNAGDAQSTFNLLSMIDQSLLAAKNTITWGVKQVSDLLEETKQLGGRYDVVEDLTNLWVFDESTSGLDKALGGAGWFANTMIDCLPAYGPAVIELILTRKVEGNVLKTTDKLMDLWKAKDFKRIGTTVGGNFLKEVALDNLIYDEAFQVMTGRPISNEEENVNLMFNLPLDFLQGVLQGNAKWFKPGMKAADFAMDEISANMLKLIRTSGDSEEELTKLAEKIYLLKGLETTEGTKEFKEFNKGDKYSISSYKETDPKLYDKIVKAMNDASGYWDRLSQYKGGVEDLLLGLQEKIGNREIKKLSTLEKLDKASQLVYGQGKFMQEAGDSLLMGAKSIGRKIGYLLATGKISDEGLKAIIQSISNVKGIDNLIIGLATGNKELVNASLVSFTNRGVQMSSSEVSQLYNNILGKLMKQNPELKEFDEIGTYVKGEDGLYRNILGDDTRYSVDEMVDILTKTSDGKVFGNEQVQLMESINNRLKRMTNAARTDRGSAALEEDVTDIFSHINGGDIFRNWDSKSIAQQKMVSQIINDTGLKLKKAKDAAGNDAGYVQVFGTYDGLLKLKSSIAEVAGGKPLNQFTPEDLAAYKMYFASDFIDSFNKYLFKVGNLNDVDKSLLEKGLTSPKFNSLEFTKNYKSWFESLFETKVIKDQAGNEQKVYKVKAAFDTKEISEQFSVLMTNSATFKEVESYAAQNIIKDITKQAMLSDKADAEIYNAIDTGITKGRYIKGYKREISPIVNSLFNQVKWLGSMGMNENDTAELLGRLFGELVVDEGTLRTLSRVDSDYLYKGIISKLLLGDESSTALYADSLNKLFKDISPESKIDLKNAMVNVEVLGSKINKRREVEDAQLVLKGKLSAIDKKIEKLQSNAQAKFSKRIKKEISNLEETKVELNKKFDDTYGVYFNKKGVLTLNEPEAIDLDRSALLNKLQGYISDINTEKFNSKLKSLELGIQNRMKLQKKGANVTTKEININRIVGASDNDLRLIADLTAFKSFEKAKLPLYGEANKMADSIYNQLMALKVGGDTRGVIYSLTEQEAKEGIINLGLLGEAKILSNVFSPDGLKYIVGNMLTSKVTEEGLPEWIAATKLNIKNLAKRSGMANLGKEYLMMLGGVEKYIKYGDNAKEQVESIINTLKNSALLDKNVVINDIIKSYKSSKAQGDNGLLLNNYFVNQLNSATAKLGETISDLYTTRMLYEDTLSNENKKDILDILKKLDETNSLFRRMEAMATTSKELTEQDVKKVLTTDMSVVELGKKGDLVNNPINILEAPRRSKSLEVNKLREKGTNERVDDFDVTNPTYNLGNKKIVVYDLETTSKELDSDVLQIAYTVIRQDENGKIITEPTVNAMFNSPKEFDAGAIEVTGITKDKVKGKDYFKSTKGQGGVYDDFKALTEDENTIFIGHNIRDFDNVVLSNAGIKINKDASIDTLRLYQALMPKTKNGYRLQDVPNEFKNIKEALKDAGGKAHEADYDVLANYYLFNYLTEFVTHNNKLANDSNLIDGLIKMSDLKAESAFSEDTSKSLMQRQLFFEGDKQDSIVTAGNYIAGKLDEAGFKEKDTVGIDDLLPFLGNILGGKGNSRTIAMFEGLKKILPEGATIDKNKIFVGGNVKKAYEEYCGQVGYEAMSIDDFVINRIVNSLLTEHGLYNDNAIQALNNFTKRASRNDLTRKLVTVNKNGWIQGSTDFTAMGALFEKLFDDGFVGIGFEKNSPKYQTMMEEFNAYVFDSHNTDLIKFNKAYYDYILTGDGSYGYTARNIFVKIMVDMFNNDGGKEAKFKNYWNQFGGANVNITGKYTRVSSNSPAKKFELGGEEDILKIRNEIATNEKEIERLKEEREKIKPDSEANKAKRKALWNKIDTLNDRNNNLEDEIYNITIDTELSKEGYIQKNALDAYDVRYMDDTVSEDREGLERLTEESERNEELIGDIGNEVGDEVEYGKIVSNKEEGQSNADQGDIRGAISNMADTLEGYIWNDLEDAITTKNNVSMNNMFHIIEDNKSIADYKGNQFNTNVTIDARITDKESKEKLLEELDSLYKEDAKKGKFEEKTNNFIYNATNYLRGQDRRLTDEQYLQVYGLDGIIGKELRYDADHGGVITDVKIKANWFSEGDEASGKSKFNSETFNYDESFDLYKMLNAIVGASKKGQGTFVVEMVHNTYKGGKDFVSSIPYSLNELWISPIGKTLLNKLDIEEEIGRYGNDAVLKTIENRIYKIAMDEKIKGDKLKRDYLDVIEFDWGDGKVDKRGPWRHRDEEVMLDALNLSGKTKWEYVKYLPENQKKSIANEIKNSRKKIAMQEAKVDNYEDLPLSIRESIEDITAKSLDNADNVEKYFNLKLYSYAKLDEEAKKAGYDNMGDLVYKTAVTDLGDTKAKDKLGWDLMKDNRFRQEVSAYYNDEIIRLYNNIDDYFGVSIDTFPDRLKKFQIVDEEGTIYKYDAHIPDFMEIEEPYEQGFRQFGTLGKEAESKSPTAKEEITTMQIIPGDEAYITRKRLDEIAKDNGYENMQDLVNNALYHNDEKAKEILGEPKENFFSKGPNHNRDLASLYNKVESTENIHTKEFEDKIKSYSIKVDAEDGSKATYKFGVYIPKEKETLKVDNTMREVDGTKDFFDEPTFRDYEDVQLIHGDRWVSSEGEIYEASREVQKDNDYNRIKNVSNPSEAVVRMLNTKTNKFEYGIVRINDGYYGRNAEGQFEGKSTTYEFIPFEGDKRFEDPIKELKGRESESYKIKQIDKKIEKIPIDVEKRFEGMLGERVGPVMKYDWKKESFVRVLPEGSKKNHIMMTENTMKDGLDEISQMDMLNKSTNNLWQTRAFSNWTNYDFFDSDKDIQQIVGSNANFIRLQGENLRIAADKFQEVFDKQKYTAEEAKKVYDRIRYVANKYIGEKKGDAKEIKIDELPDELVEALNGVAKVFVDGGWTPIHQFANINKDGMEGMIKNIAHNHMGASLNYFKTGSREKVQSNLKTIIGNYEPRESVAMNAVKDLMGDPLGTGKMYDALTGIRAMWRFIKYGPLIPLTGVMMLVNSFIMGNIRYAGEKRGVLSLMKNPWFDALIAKAGDPVNVGGKQIKGIGMTDGLNRANEIMFNSNSDLGGSWFDKALDLVIKPLPEGKLKTAVATALKGGTHSLYDLLAQGSVKTMAFAKALARNGVTEENIENFVTKYLKNQIPEQEINKILGDTERIYSRFFTNSSTAFFSRHRFSRMYMFNALQGYVINRTDEITSSIKNCVNWINHRHQLAVANGYKGLDGTTWKDFVDYLQTDNQELQSFLMNILMSAKMGFYMQKIVDGGELDTENYRNYIIDSSDYLSSIEANFVYSLLMAPFEGLVDYAEYTQNNYDDFELGQGLTVAGLKTVSDLCSKFFREGKVLNAFMDSIVAYGQTNKVDFAYDVLVKDFQKIADGLGRFQLVEGTNLYGLDNLSEDRDILGKVLFNNDKTSYAGQVTSKLQSLSTVDSILNGEDGSFWKDKMLPYLPIIGPAIQNATTGNGYSFSAAKYDELIHIMDKDPIVQTLNNWDLFNEDGGQIWFNPNIYSDEAMGRLYQELTSFDYPNKQQLSGGRFETGYEYNNEPMKEEVFTQEMLDQLGWSEQDLERYLLEGSGGKNKKAGLLKVMAAAEASRPGSSKIVISYLASKYENDRIKEITGDKYGSWKDLSVQAQNDLQRETVSKFYPYMFFADKTSWYKAITEYISGKYELFDTLYKDDNLKGYVNTLGYMDMLMYQQAQDGNVNARFIKNSWSMLSKYMKSEPARINAINYIMSSINQNNMSMGQAAAAKMGVLAANMDFYDKIYNNGMLQAIYGEDIDTYNNYVWGVLKDINEIGYNTAKNNLGDSYSSGYSKRKPYTYDNPMGDQNIPTTKQFVPQAQKYLRGKTPSGGYNKYTPNTYKPGKTLDWYFKYYEGLIKTYSDRLVKSKGKKYPAQTIEGITFKTGNSNRGRIKRQELEFPRHKSKEYRTKLFSNLPGSHG